MSNNLEGLPTEQLRAMMQQCWQTINSILDRLNDAPKMQAGTRRLMNSEDMVTEFSMIVAESPELANLILQASVAVLGASVPRERRTNWRSGSNPVAHSKSSSNFHRGAAGRRRIPRRGEVQRLALTGRRRLTLTSNSA